MIRVLAGQVPATWQAAYHHTESFPAIVGGQTLSSFEFDAKTRRLFAGSPLGLYWLNVDQPKPFWHGPLLATRVGGLEFAPELRRLFFSTADDLRYIDVDAPEKMHVLAPIRNAGLRYEPQCHLAQ